MPNRKQASADEFQVLLNCRSFATRWEGLTVATEGDVLLVGSLPFDSAVEFARRYLPAFGVASACGFGRVSREDLPAIPQAHRDCAVELERAEVAPGASAS
jgi:hypothetical protein